MNIGDDHNPYAPPTQFDNARPPANHDDGELHFPAERMDRLLARLVDLLLVLACMLPWATLLILLDVFTLEDLGENALASLVISFAALPLAVYQWTRIVRTGQTIGKKLLRIRIVKLDGSKVGFGHGVALREWITQLISVVPCVGPLVNFVGIMMIFGDERRCLHDRIAGTKVVKTLAG